MVLLSSIVQQEAGLAEVLWANERKDDVRHFLASFILLGFNLVLNNFIGSSECDLELCKRILAENLEKYPDGAFFQFFKGRFHFVQGEIPQVKRQLNMVEDICGFAITRKSHL